MSPEAIRNCAHHLPGIVRLAEGVQGLLTAREMEFLALLGACPTAAGEILEIGSFKGRSTVLLAAAAALAGDGRIVAVDPLVRTSSSDPHAGGESSWEHELYANLERCGVAEAVEFHQTVSVDLAGGWNRKLRLLWIDGDHTQEGTKADFDCFAPYLENGAIVAIHDVLHGFPGPIRVFAEDILPSDRFGSAGLCGSIGWAQHLADPASARRHAREKARLCRRLSRVVPYEVHGRVTGLKKIAYRFYRFLIPHGRVDPEEWLRTVEFFGGPG